MNPSGQHAQKIGQMATMTKQKQIHWINSQEKLRFEMLWLECHAFWPNAAPHLTINSVWEMTGLNLVLCPLVLQVQFSSKWKKITFKKRISPKNESVKIFWIIFVFLSWWSSVLEMTPQYTHFWQYFDKISGCLVFLVLWFPLKSYYLIL